VITHEDRGDGVSLCGQVSGSVWLFDEVPTCKKCQRCKANRTPPRDVPSDAPKVDKIRRGIDHGMTTRGIALWVGCSDRYVRMIRADL